MSKGLNFNCIEIIPSKYDNSPVLIHIFWKSKWLINFGPVNPIFLFTEFLNKNNKNKKTPTVFYVPNLEMVFSSILFMGGGYSKKIKFFAIKSRIYYIKIEIGNQPVLFKNFNLYIRGSLEKLNIKDIGQYTPLGFYPGTEEKITEMKPYTEIGDETVGGCYDWREMRKLMGDGRNKKVSYITSFYEKENLSEKEISLLIEELPNKIKTNLIILNSTLIKINNLLSILLKNWYFNYSIASISVDVFYKLFNSYELEIENSAEEDKNIRSSYIGGRCEVFGNAYTNETIYHYDFESMYGQTMLEDFPTGSLELMKNLKNIEKPGFYYVTIRSHSMKIPILPIKEINNIVEEVVWEESTGEGIFFPNGSFSGLFYSEEIELFIKEGGVIIKIHHAFIFSGKKKPIFKEFASYLINLKSEEKSEIWKSLLVSFYGRLGMSPNNTKIEIGNKEDYKIKTTDKEILQETWFDNIFLAEIKIKENLKVNSKVEYASIITAKARIKLWKNIKIIESEGGRVLYCDTDSIFASFNSSKEILNTQMGDVFWDKEKKKTKLEGAVFAGTRNYSIKFDGCWETKIAGLPRNSIEYESFKKNFYLNSLNKYEIKNIKKNIFKTEMWNTTSIISLNNYNKRVFSLDKKTTTPLYKIGVNDLIEDPFIDKSL